MFARLSRRPNQADWRHRAFVRFRVHRRLGSVIDWVIFLSIRINTFCFTEGDGSFVKHTHLDLPDMFSSNLWAISKSTVSVYRRPSVGLLKRLRMQFTEGHEVFVRTGNTSLWCLGREAVLGWQSLRRYREQSTGLTDAFVVTYRVHPKVPLST